MTLIDYMVLFAVTLLIMELLHDLYVKFASWKERHDRRY
jgi:hypothetical protein